MSWVGVVVESGGWRVRLGVVSACACVELMEPRFECVYARVCAGERATSS